MTTIEETLRLVVREEIRFALEEQLSKRSEPVPATPALDLLAVDDVAALCRVAPAAVRGWIRTGRLIGKKVGRRYLVERAALQRFLSTVQPLARNQSPEPEAEVARILQRVRGGG